MDLESVEPYLLADRRVFSPEPDHIRPALRLSGQPARIVSTPIPRKSTPKAILPKLHNLSFKLPQSVSICVKRNTRKEVLHATKVAGKIGLRKPKRNAFSNISC